VGDYQNTPPFTIQAKCRRSGSLGAWLQQAAEQAERAKQPYPVVIHKRWGSMDPGAQFVSMTLETFLAILDGYNKGD
jgi:hypothetical protein